MKSKWLSELKKIGFLRLGLLAVAAIILIICSLPQNQSSNLNQAQSTGWRRTPDTVPRLCLRNLQDDQQRQQHYRRTANRIGDLHQSLQP